MPVPPPGTSPWRPGYPLSRIIPKREVEADAARFNRPRRWRSEGLPRRAVRRQVPVRHLVRCTEGKPVCRSACQPWNRDALASSRRMRQEGELDVGCEAEIRIRDWTPGAEPEVVRLGLAKHAVVPGGRPLQDHEAPAGRGDSEIGHTTWRRGVRGGRGRRGWRRRWP